MHRQAEISGVVWLTSPWENRRSAKTWDVHAAKSGKSQDSRIRNLKVERFMRVYFRKKTFVSESDAKMKNLRSSSLSFSQNAQNHFPRRCPTRSFREMERLVALNRDLDAIDSRLDQIELRQAKRKTDQLLSGNSSSLPIKRVLSNQAIRDLARSPEADAEALQNAKEIAARRALGPMKDIPRVDDLSAAVNEHVATANASSHWAVSPTKISKLGNRASPTVSSSRFEALRFSDDSVSSEFTSTPIRSSETCKPESQVRSV